MRYEWEPYLKYGHIKNVANNETLFSQGEGVLAFTMWQKEK